MTLQMLDKTTHQVLLTGTDEEDFQFQVSDYLEDFAKRALNTPLNTYPDLVCAYDGGTELELYMHSETADDLDKSVLDWYAAHGITDGLDSINGIEQTLNVAFKATVTE